MLLFRELLASPVNVVLGLVAPLTLLAGDPFSLKQ